MTIFQILAEMLYFLSNIPKVMDLLSKLPKAFVKVLTELEFDLVIEVQHVWYI